MKNLFSLKLFVVLFTAFLLMSCKGNRVQPDIQIAVPMLQDFHADGNLSEWAGIKATRLYANALGQYPDPKDLGAWIKTAWNSEGMIVALDIEDNEFVTDTTSPWTADAVEVFLSPYRGSSDIIQLSFAPVSGNDGKPFVNINDFRETPALHKIQPVIAAAFTRKENHTFWEIQVNPLCVGINPEIHNSIALQVYVDDADKEGSKTKNQIIWYNLGNSYLNSFAMYKVNFTEDESTVLNGTSDLYITDGQKASLKIFGAVKGDKIQIDRNGKKFFEGKALSEDSWKPDTLSFTKNDLDFGHDSLLVFINNEPVGFHNLFISPRLYVKTERKPFDAEIRSFEMKDRISFPPANATLFIGSSSIRKWSSLKEDFPELKIIHRGFGGSTSKEALMYMDKIVLPYKPATIVYYEGDNDIPRGYPAEMIKNNVRSFVDRVLKQRPDTKIFILSPKPAINRMNYWPKYVEAQDQLKSLAAEYPNVTYIDVSTPMFDQKGNLKKEIFVSDGIHMNSDGYRIWTRVIRHAMGLKE